MRWSIPLGRISGIALRLHVTFLLLLLAVGYGIYQDGGLLAAAWGVGLVCAIFLCIGLHELGHSLVAQHLGVEVRSITLLPIGGLAALKRIPENPWHEIAITVAGPLVNAVIAALLILVTGVPHHPFAIVMPVNLSSMLVALVSANLSLFIFNLIPAFPMDGGRLFRATLALLLPYRRATTAAVLVGQGIAVMFIMNWFGFLPFLSRYSSLWLLIIGVFIFFGAEGEERIVRRRTVLADYAVADLMSRLFATLEPRESVERGLQLIYQTGQDDFPVVTGGRVVGMISRAAMLDAINKKGLPLIVGEVMDLEFLTAQPQDKLAVIDAEVHSEGWGSVPVIDAADQLVGLLTPENINRFLRLQASLKSARRPPIPRGVFAHTPAPPPVIATVPPVATPPPHAESVPPAGQA